MTTRSPARSVPFLAVAVLGLLAFLPGAARAADGDPTLQERVAALKQSLAESQKALRTYQWVETTTVSMKGEVKSQKQTRRPEKLVVNVASSGYRHMN